MGGEMHHGEGAVTRMELNGTNSILQICCLTCDETLTKLCLFRHRQLRTVQLST